jgi:hypothetical protein
LEFLISKPVLWCTDGSLVEFSKPVLERKEEEEEEEGEEEEEEKDEQVPAWRRGTPSLRALVGAGTLATESTSSIGYSGILSCHGSPGGQTSTNQERSKKHPSSGHPLPSLLVCSLIFK